MSKPRAGAPKRVVAGLLAGALGTFGLALASPAFAVEDVSTERFSGENRWETAELIAADPALDNPTTAIVASGDNDHLIDSLSASGLAGDNAPAPIVVTNGDELQDHTQDALEALQADGVTGVTILGGVAAVSADVEAEIEALGLAVTRVEGPERWETAVAAANAMGTIGEVNGLTTAVIANGFGNAFSPDVPIDALAASSVAYDQNLPVLLTMTDQLIPATADALADLGIEQVIIAGGVGAISASVEDEIEDITGSDAIRLGGGDRWETAAAIGEFAITTLGWPATTVILANGQTGVDALAAGPLAGELQAPIVLALDNILPPPSEEFLDDHSDTIAEILVAGGEAAIGPLVAAEAEAAAETTENDEPTTNQDFDVTPDDAVTLSHNGTVEATTPDDDRTYTVQGLTEGTTYRIALFPGANVTDDDGTITFRDADGTANVADDAGSTAVASIVAVNNSTITATGSTTATPVFGGITFRIDGSGTGSVVPVVWVDADAGSDLDLDASDQPTEMFGVGGVTNYLPGEGTGGSIAGPHEVTLVDKTADLFVANGARYDYDSNDVYSIDGVPSTFAQFEAALSSSDQIDGVYAPDPGAQSTFQLTDQNPGTPTIGTATQSGSSVVLTWTASGDDVDFFNIYRAASANNTDCTTTAAAAYTVVATDTASPYTDSSVTVPEQYCYQVSEVNDGDEGTRSGAAFVSLTAADATAPTITEVKAIEDNTFAGQLDASDVHRFIFSEAMATTVDDAGSAYRVQDGDGTVADLTCGTGGTTCVLNLSPVTIGTTTYPAQRVLTVTVGATQPAIVTAGTGAGVQYPVTIVQVTAHWDDTVGNQLNLAGSADTTIEVDESAPATTAVFPTITSAVADESDDTVTVTYSEPVTCTGADPSQFTYTDPDNAGTAATGLTCNGTATVVATFADLVIEVADGPGSVTYTESGTAANRVLDLDANEAVSPDTESSTVQA